jgi:aspartokinase
LALIVQKFGGSSVGDAAKIKLVAERVIETHRAGNKVVVVVSAKYLLLRDEFTLGFSGFKLW